MQATVMDLRNALSDISGPKTVTRSRNRPSP